MSTVTVHVRADKKGVMQAVGLNVEAGLQTLFVDTMVEVAKMKSPRLTGHNASSIWSKKAGHLYWNIGTASNYGAHLELGTQRMPGRPYFLPAAEEARRAVAESSAGDWQ